MTSPALRTARAALRELGHSLPPPMRERAVERGVKALDEVAAEMAALQAELKARAEFDDGEGGANR